MTALREIAHAKLNLTLEVLGRRPDGFHELRSLVAFTELGDELQLVPGGELSLAIEGPFAACLSGSSSNLISAAAEAAKRAVPTLKLGAFKLVKNLPVAAGLGGGSADAAAALRLLARANPGALDSILLAKIGAQLGSDVTVCLASKPALMTGRGEKVTAVDGLPDCGMVLANPGRQLATRDVYAALQAPMLPEAAAPARLPALTNDFDRLIAYAAPRGNSLEAPATRLAPSIGDVLAALNALPGARIVRLCGSGPTCFALFATEDEAKGAAAALKASHPAWWIAQSRI